MTESEIMKYRSLNLLIGRKNAQIDKLNDVNIPVIFGKVKASSKHFPYIETHPTVLIEEPKEADRIKYKRESLQKEIDELNERVQSIEDYIDNISDPELQNIFEMRVYDGMKWNDIAAEFEDEKNRTTYSRKFRKYLEKIR